MKFQFLGCGDAFGSGGRFNTCFHVTGRTTRFLIDCGASSMIAIRRFGVDPNAIETVFLTHLHGDHFGGLPFLILDAQLVSRRTTPLTVVGPPGTDERLRQAMELFFPGSTEIERRFAVDVVELEPHVRRTINNVDVTPYLMRHPSGAPPFALRLEEGGKSICYTGDTEWVDDLVPAAQDVDLFVAEAYFAEPKVRYHLDWKTLEERLPGIRPRRLVITHLSGAMLAHPPPGCDIAEDGMILEF